MEMKTNSNNTCLANSIKENEQSEAVDILVWVIWAIWDNLTILTQISLLAKCNSNLFQLLGRTKEAINTCMVLQVTPRTIIMGCKRVKISTNNLIEAILVKSWEFITLIIVYQTQALHC